MSAFHSEKKSTEKLRQREHVDHAEPKSLNFQRKVQSPRTPTSKLIIGIKSKGASRCGIVSENRHLPSLRRNQTLRHDNVVRS